MLSAVYAWLIVLPLVIVSTGAGTVDLRAGRAGWAAAELLIALVAAVETLWLAA